MRIRIEAKDGEPIGEVLEKLAGRLTLAKALKPSKDFNDRMPRQLDQPVLRQYAQRLQRRVDKIHAQMIRRMNAVVDEDR